MNPLIARAIAASGTQAKLSALSGLSQQHISRLLNNRQRVTAEAAMKIESATGGQVTRSELCPHIWPTEAGRAA